jgi:hypothetical protein
MLSKIKESVSVLMDFTESFENISKNDRISFLSLNPSESEMQPFHHRTILGGSWSDPEKHLIAILVSDSYAKPIQILPKFIKDVKVKTHSVDEFISSRSNEEEFMTLKNPKTDFMYKNIIPLPNLLSRTRIERPNHCGNELPKNYDYPWRIPRFLNQLSTI